MTDNTTTRNNINTNARNHSKTLSMTYMAIFAALIAICSWISIPSSVPFTMQTFAIFLTCGLLGGKRSTIAVLVYLLLGAIGLPVFAGFSGGLGALFGMTGGYLIGFVFIGLIAWLFEKLFGKKAPALIAALVVGLIVCYAFGTAWFMFMYTKNVGSIGLTGVLGMCVFPFIIPDLIKMALALILTNRLKKFIKL